jgi:hypothetical protein
MGMQLLYCLYSFFLLYTSGITNLPQCLLSHIPVTLLHLRLRSTSTSTTTNSVTVAKELMCVRHL